jgi:tetratricopeptide (TPR) repeat protein
VGWISRKYAPANNTDLEIDKPLYSPFIERYMLDELKQLRQDQQAMKAEFTEKVVNARLDVADRAIRYTADTTNTIFYIITAAASIFVFLGWKSVKDIKDAIESTIAKRVDELTLEYEERLDKLEATIKERSNQIVATQKKISDSNAIHSLWMRAGLEKSDAEKINIYDQILEISPQDVEALTYKADTLLDMDEDSWALSLANQAVECDSAYALAYWQRGCAKAKLGQHDDAIEDIKTALSLSSTLKEELVGESYFENLKENEGFQELIRD